MVYRKIPLSSLTVYSLSSFLSAGSAAQVGPGADCDTVPIGAKASRQSAGEARSLRLSERALELTVCSSGEHVQVDNLREYDDLTSTATLHVLRVCTQTFPCDFDACARLLNRHTRCMRAFPL
eukprot:4892054-Pleurochrysis_carterae.AAC.3